MDFKMFLQTAYIDDNTHKQGLYMISATYVIFTSSQHIFSQLNVNECTQRVAPVRYQQQQVQLPDFGIKLTHRTTSTTATMSV